MKKLLFIICLLLIEIPKLYSIENYPAGARSLALSHSFISISDVWATFHNQAGLAGFESITSGVFYESKFLVDELSLIAGAMVLPVNAGTLGISFFQFGIKSWILKFYLSWVFNPVITGCERYRFNSVWILHGIYGHKSGLDLAKGWSGNIGHFSLSQCL